MHSFRPFLGSSVDKILQKLERYLFLMTLPVKKSFEVSGHWAWGLLAIDNRHSFN